MSGRPSLQQENKHKKQKTEIITVYTAASKPLLSGNELTDRE